MGHEKSHKIRRTIMKKFLTSNDALYRMLRTVLQGIIGVIIANLDVLIARLSFSPELKPIIVALCMAILSPIMAEIGRATEEKEDIPVIEEKEGEE